MDARNKIRNMTENNGASFINKWWKVGVLSVLVVAGWTTLQIGVLANTTNIEKIDTELKVRGTAITVNEVNISTIQSDIREIKIDQREILRELRNN